MNRKVRIASMALIFSALAVMYLVVSDSIASMPKYPVCINPDFELVPTRSCLAQFAEYGAALAAVTSGFWKEMLGMAVGFGELAGIVLSVALSCALVMRGIDR
jgi:hypothetical protein